MNPPITLPTHFKRKIELIDTTGLKMNLKNLILYLFLLENSCLTFDEILKKLKEKKILSNWAKTPKRVALDLAELKAFNIILAKSEKKDIKNQIFILNYNKLNDFYGHDFIELGKIMRNHFSTN